ncbi:hypothetical protein [Marinomonas sp. GJ51-6]|uniref:hypothetical protein n=1 Tax=Marinomonas sp. GJ51-6 TaxID=2992802 RepID=UPI0029352345|nr:hypothetical protein [Marinomonas sp. GJ51-6]WOD08097.1 hypothetical protein ONZ50_02755 [Marinomonas sp. GJ51-6]
MTDTLTHLFLGAPLETIPTSKNKAPYIALKLLADGKTHARDELTKLLGETWRSGLQRLRGDDFQYWLIHSVKQPNSKITDLQLDPRHLSGNPVQDAAARLERCRQLKRDSYKEAQQGWKRLPKAHTAMLEADKAYLQSLGEAANDATQEDNK